MFENEAADLVTNSGCDVMAVDKQADRSWQTRGLCTLAELSLLSVYFYYLSGCI